MLQQYLFFSSHILILMMANFTPRNDKSMWCRKEPRINCFMSLFLLRDTLVNMLAHNFKRSEQKARISRQICSLFCWDEEETWTMMIWTNFENKALMLTITTYQIWRVYWSQSLLILMLLLFWIGILIELFALEYQQIFKISLHHFVIIRRPTSWRCQGLICF